MMNYFYQALQFEIKADGQVNFKLLSTPGEAPVPYGIAFNNNGAHKIFKEGSTKATKSVGDAWLVSSSTFRSFIIR